MSTHGPHEAQFGLNAAKVRQGLIVDGILRRTLGPLVRPRGPQPPLAAIDPKTVLVLYPQLIGDVVLLSGFLCGLRRRYPRTHIAVVGQKFLDELLGGQGYYDAFFEFRCPWRAFDYSAGNLRKMALLLARLRRRSWDLAIDLRGDLRNIAFLYATGARYRVALDGTGGDYLLTHPLRAPATAKHLVESNRFVLEALGGIMSEPRLAISEADRTWARQTITELVEPGKRIFAIHPGTSRESKHWFPDRFALLAEHLEARYGAALLLVLGPADQALGASILERSRARLHVVQPPLGKLPALLASCDLLIGLDSAAAHIAGAVGSPALALFGPSDPHVVRPVGQRSHVVIKEGFACRPCGLGTCPLGVEKSCMFAIQPADVLEGIALLLGSTGDVH